MSSYRNYGVKKLKVKPRYIYFILKNHYYGDFKKFYDVFKFKHPGKKYSQNRIAYFYLVHGGLLDLFYASVDYDFDLKLLNAICKPGAVSYL